MCLHTCMLDISFGTGPISLLPDNSCLQIYPLPYGVRLIPGGIGVMYPHQRASTPDAQYAGDQDCIKGSAPQQILLLM